MSVLVVIPARMASTRFPGKPLVPLGGKPMLRWVYEAALGADLGPVVVATPDDEILAAVRAFGADAERTRLDHPSGTDRIAELAERREADVYVNVQGDEPLIDPRTIVACALPLLADPACEMATAAVPLPFEEIATPSTVKVVASLSGDALYFSRAPIPYPRDPDPALYRKHLGIYAYRRSLLRRYATWPQTPLERSEGLEQLRFLEHGVRIRVAEGYDSGLAVDLPEHVAPVELALRERSERGAA